MLQAPEPSGPTGGLTPIRPGRIIRAVNPLSQIYEAILNLDSPTVTTQERLACLQETDRVVRERLADLNPTTRNHGRRNADQFRERIK